MTIWNAIVPLPQPGAPYLPRLLPSENVRGVVATITFFPIPYVLVLAPIARFFELVDPVNERHWEDARVWLARSSGLSWSATVPKLGLVAAGDDEPVFRTRMGLGLGWHPGAPGGGLLAFGGAALREGTVPSLACGDPAAASWTIGTPAGRRTVRYRMTPDGRPGLALSICTTAPDEIR